MTRIRIALVSAFAISSLVAGGAVAHAHASAHSAHHLAGPVPCCWDDDVAHV